MIPVQVARIHIKVLKNMFITAPAQFPFSNKLIVSIEKEEKVV